MTRGGLGGLIGVLVLLVGAWALGGVLFEDRPDDLGGVVVVRPSGGSPRDAPTAPSIGLPARSSPSATPSQSPRSPEVGAPPSNRPAPSGGATKVPDGPAPEAGDDDDDDDGIEDADEPDRKDDPDEFGVDDDSDD